jgi:wyosine [tRNA(Phe)-imidazoG37] synthetase (radical SAM superfamily)
MWREIFSEADSLGASQLTISSGEPTLYEHLTALIREGKGYGWKEIIPQAIHSCGSLEPLARLAARKNINRIFSPDILSISRWAWGE